MKLNTLNRFRVLVPLGLIVVVFCGQMVRYAYATLAGPGQTQQTFSATDASSIPKGVGITPGMQAWVRTVGTSWAFFTAAEASAVPSVDGLHVLAGPTGIRWVDDTIRVRSLPYSSLTGVPSTFTASTHASTHRPGGSDAPFTATAPISISTAGVISVAAVTSNTPGIVPAPGGGSGVYVASAPGYPTWASKIGVGTYLVPGAASSTTVLCSDGATNMWESASACGLQPTVDWHSTIPTAADHVPTYIQAGRGIDLEYDNTGGINQIIVQTNFDVPAGPVPSWHITGGADVTPNRVDTGAGLKIEADGTGGVVVSTNGVKFVNDDELYSVTDGNGYRHSEFTTRGIVQLTNNTTITIALVTETQVGMTGTIYSADYPDLNVFVEIEIETEGLTPGTPPSMGLRPDRAVFYSHLTSTFYTTSWQLAITMYENEALRSPPFAGSETHPFSGGVLSLVRSGTNNGTWTIQATTADWSAYTFKWPTVAYKLRILGEGRFVVS